MASRFNRPRQYSIYQPKSVQELALPGQMEAQALGTKLAALNQINTGFTGFDFDKQRLNDSIEKVKNDKEVLVSKIINGDDVSYTDAMNLSNNYSDLYGQSGKVTFAENQYDKYITDMAEYKKNWEKYDPTTVNYFTNKSLQEYRDNPAAGLTMSPVAQTQDIAKQMNESVKAMTKNQTITTEQYTAAGLRPQTSNGKPTGRYIETKSGREMSKLEADNMAAYAAVRDQVMSDPKNSRFVSQYTTANKMTPDSYMYDIFENSVAINKIDKTTIKESSVTLPKTGTGKTGKSVETTEDGGNFFNNTLGGVIQNTDLQKSQLIDIENNIDNFARFGASDYTAAEATEDRNAILKAVGKGKTPENMSKLSKKYAVDLSSFDLTTEKGVEDARRYIDSEFMGKINEATNMSHEGKEFLNKGMKGFFEENEGAKEAYEKSGKTLKGLDKKYLRYYTNDMLNYSPETAKRITKPFVDKLYAQAKSNDYKGDRTTFENELEQSVIWRSQYQDKAADYLEDYYDKNKGEFKGSEAAYYSIDSGLKTSDRGKLDSALENIGNIVSANPSSKGVHALGDKDKVLGEYTVSNIPWSMVDIQGVSVGTKNNTLAVNMSMDSKEGGRQSGTVVFDGNTVAGRAAMTELLDYLPQDKYTDNLRLDVENNGLAGDTPSSIKQNVYGDSRFKYNLTPEETVNFTYTDPESGVTHDYTPLYEAELIGNKELQKPEVQKFINGVRDIAAQNIPGDPAKQSAYIRKVITEQYKETPAVGQSLIIAIEKGISPDVLLNYIEGMDLTGDIKEYSKDIEKDQDPIEKRVTVHNYYKKLNNYGK